MFAWTVNSMNDCTIRLAQPGDKASAYHVCLKTGNFGRDGEPLKPFVNVTCTTPPIIGHYLVSGGDWRTAVWGAVSIVIAMLVYLPFAKGAGEPIKQGAEIS